MGIYMLYPWIRVAYGAMASVIGTPVLAQCCARCPDVTNGIRARGHGFEPSLIHKSLEDCRMRSPRRLSSREQQRAAR